MIDFDDLDEIEEANRKRTVAFVDFWPGFDDNTDRWVSKTWFERNLLGVEIVGQYDDPEVVVFSLFGHRNIHIERRRRSKLVCFIGENVRPPLHEVPLCISYDHTPNVPPSVHTRLPLWVFNEELHEVLRLHEARLRGDFDSSIRHRRGFCSWVASNTVDYDSGVRLRFVELLSSSYRSVACGGKALNNVGGPVEDKAAFLRGYRFNVSFENSSYPGYCTEKVLHAFAAGCIPIYWGDPLQATSTDATKGAGAPDFNPAALISAHDFENFEELVEHIKKVDRDPELFESYLRQPILSEHWHARLKNWPEFQRHLTDLILHDAAAYRRDEDDSDCEGAYDF